jgi:serine/threonine-protein kinase
MSPKALEHRPGERIGSFTLERPLGKGAAAEVWLAVETTELGFTKRQALKLLQPPPDELEEQKAALLNEARVCGLLKHPGIVDVYKVDSIEGELFIAMEFVDGPDLNTLLHALRVRSISLPVGAAVEIAIELLEALDYAHNARDDKGASLGIVHRDLKPSNVLVDRRGVLKITDWGLVKSHLNIDATTRGVVKGTPGYIAPEVWGGTREFKPAADLFAVGAILYEAIMGERLFHGRNLARIAEQVAKRDPATEAAGVAERCPDLVPILEKLLQRNPDDRYPAARQLLGLLREIREQFPARESFKAFLRENADLIEEIAPLRTHQAADIQTSKAVIDARNAETVEDEAHAAEAAVLLDPREDSLWNGSLEDGDEKAEATQAAAAEPRASAEDHAERAETAPIPIVVKTRAMPSVDKGVPSGHEVNALPNEAEDTMFEGMEESGHYGMAEAAPAAAEAEAEPTSEAAEAAIELAEAVEEPDDIDEDAEETQGGVAAPLVRDEGEGESEGEGEGESEKPRRKRRRSSPQRDGLSGRVPALIAACIAIGGISLLLTGVGFILLW